MLIHQQIIELGKFQHITAGTPGKAHWEPRPRAFLSARIRAGRRRVCKAGGVGRLLQLATVDKNAIKNTRAK